jgi:hypothetical protein
MYDLVGQRERGISVEIGSAWSYESELTAAQKLLTIVPPRGNIAVVSRNWRPVDRADRPSGRARTGGTPVARGGRDELLDLLGSSRLARSVVATMRFLMTRCAYSVRQWLSAISFGLLAVAICSCQRSSDTIPSVTLGAPSGVITFARDVAPIIFKRCAACHHQGEAAPFSLLSYDDVRRRAQQIVNVTQKRFMPPWLPTEGDEQFVGPRRLTDHELQTLQGWVDAGAPRGDESELPAAPVFTDGWQTGTPDLVLESPAFRLSSGGGDVFRNFVVPIQLESPRWVQSIELRPENPRVTHHARLGVDRSGESLRRESNDGQPGYAGMAWGQDPDGQLVIWAPGMVAKPGTPGVAWRLYPDTCLVLHTHMQPSGKT